MRIVMGVVLVCVVIAAGVVGVAFRADMSAARERIGGKTTVVSSPYGELEYVQGGAGPPVLVVHGAGGGYDQGELVVQGVLGDGFRFIVPSRFGYLGSTASNGATPDDQAHAFAWLLDRLDIERVAVVALSAGGPSALLFAATYPERVSSLTLLSTGVTVVATEDQPGADEKGSMLVRLFRYDFPYWAASKVFRKQLMTLMGADAEVIASLSDDQRESIDQVIEYMNPASLRYQGAVLDNRNPLPDDRIASILAPTLIVHAEDDRLQLFDNAAFAATTIPGSRFLRFSRGGHFVMIIEQATVREEVRRHILDGAR